MIQLLISRNKLTFILLLKFILISTIFPQNASNSKPQSSNYSSRYDHYTSGNSILSEAADPYSKNQKNIFHHPNYNDEKDSFPRQKRERNNYTEKGKLTKDKTENYFHIDKSGKTLWDGKHWIASQFPLKVYIQESSSRYYKTVYKKYVAYAFNVWRKADDRINYKIVANKRDADVIIKFVEDLGKNYEDNYLGLTEYEVNDDNEIELSTIQISLLKFGTEKISDGEIKATIIHEIGHAFGLGHSDNELDIMYPYISSDHIPEMNFDELSSGDKEAVKDVINLTDENYYVWK